VGQEWHDSIQANSDSGSGSLAVFICTGGTLRKLQVVNDYQALCFPAQHSATQCISDMALLNAIRRMGFGKDEMTIHSFRALFFTMLNEMKLAWDVDRDVIEAQLARKEQNAVRGAYNHASYLEQCRDMPRKWADYLDELCADTAVVA
jgi:integrase